MPADGSKQFLFTGCCAAGADAFQRRQKSKSTFAGDDNGISVAQFSAENCASVCRQLSHYVFFQYGTTRCSSAMFTDRYRAQPDRRFDIGNALTGHGAGFQWPCVAHFVSGNHAAGVDMLAAIALLRGIFTEQAMPTRLKSCLRSTRYFRRDSLQQLRSTAHERSPVGSRCRTTVKLS